MVALVGNKQRKWAHMTSRETLYTCTDIANDYALANGLSAAMNGHAFVGFETIEGAMEHAYNV